MKVCEHCGDEIGTPDGDNLCPSCDRRDKRNAAAKRSRNERAAAYRSCGMVKVRGGLGGTYWE